MRKQRRIKGVLIGKKGEILGNIQGSMIGVVEAIGGLLILWFGSLMVIRNEITLGQLLTFNALLAYFLSPLKNLIGLQQQIQSAVVASERLSEIIDLDLEYDMDEEKKYKPQSLRGDIEFIDVQFRYGSRRIVINNLSMKIKQGETIAIVGESGSGKTTLAKLLLNLYKLEKGEIRIDTMDIETINIECLRKHIGYVSQEVFLFSGSIEENLFLGQDQVNFNEMIQVCKMLKIDDFIQLLPKKYQSALIEGGHNLSGGQRQRLAIARALLKNPSLLILDEATSNLDAKAEEAITEVLFNQYKAMTKIIIAHRLSTIRKADKIALMDQGEIREFGSHVELIKQKGLYYELWESQVGTGEVEKYAK